MPTGMSRDEPPEMAQLGMQVDQAFVDVRRDESVGPAAAMGLVAAGLPLVMLLVALAMQIAA